MAEEQERRPAGELEASVLAALWAAETPLTPGEVQRALADGLARTTVTTILTRLHAKGTVTRDRAGRGYAYRPAQDAHGLTARRMHAELDKDDDRGTVLARFVSELSSEDEQMLRALLDGGDGDGGDSGTEGGTGSGGRGGTGR
ncbi:BlaI/MecI/CopY family transcriptional regulator [Streptomyces sp. NBC_01003]|uniref:BlaI/MecI/CopY family transcriptional regulator n=1 Tax=Streptomyces sp. NBC_01003 TaxID=2903714 RepID=UPI0038650B1A|nr:BlaI/MecI/CopY family transcriptional regulator [Streptomyces sp. NBC_01003]